MKAFLFFLLGAWCGLWIALINPQQGLMVFMAYCLGGLGVLAVSKK